MTSKDSSQNETEDGATTARENDAATPLREAREAAGLSLDEVATQLNLGVATIEALESGAYEQLPPPAFVRGYLRGYARLLQLDVDLILDRYEARRPSEPTISRVSRVVSQPGSGHPLMRWATVLIVVALVGMAAIWWQREYRETVPVMSMPGPVDKTDIDPSTAFPAASEPSVMSLRSDEPTRDVIAAGGKTPLDASAVGDLVAEPEADVADNSDRIDAPPAAPAEPVAPLAVPPASVAAVAEPQAVPSGDLLVAQSRGESWMEVTDADGERLYFDLLRGGAPARLQGRAPFQIFLGNAPVVNLQINGLEVDKSSFTRSNNTARFVIERDGARRR